MKDMGIVPNVYYLHLDSLDTRDWVVGLAEGEPPGVYAAASARDPALARLPVEVAHLGHPQGVVTGPLLDHLLGSLLGPFLVPLLHLLIINPVLEGDFPSFLQNSQFTSGLRNKYFVTLHSKGQVMQKVLPELFILKHINVIWLSGHVFKSNLCFT